MVSHLANVPRQALDAIRASPPEPRWQWGEYYEWHKPPPGYSPANINQPTIPLSSADSRPRSRRFRRSPGPRVVSFEPPYEEDEYGFGNDPVDDLRYEPIWSTRDVADYFGVKAATVRQWVKRGHLTPCGKVGPSHILERSDVFDAAGDIDLRRKPAGRPDRPQVNQADPDRQWPGIPPEDWLLSARRGVPRSHSPTADDVSHRGFGTRALHRLAAVTPNAIVTTTEAATMLGLAPATFRAWVRRGHLQPTPAPSRVSGDGASRQLHFRVADIYLAARRR